MISKFSPRRLGWILIAWIFGFCLLPDSLATLAVWLCGIWAMALVSTGFMRWTWVTGLWSFWLLWQWIGLLWSPAPALSLLSCAVSSTLVLIFLLGSSWWFAAHRRFWLATFWVMTGFYFAFRVLYWRVPLFPDVVSPAQWRAALDLPWSVFLHGYGPGAGSHYIPQAASPLLLACVADMGWISAALMLWALFHSVRKGFKQAHWAQISAVLPALLLTIGAFAMNVSFSPFMAGLWFSAIALSCAALGAEEEIEEAEEWSAPGWIWALGLVGMTMACSLNMWARARPLESYLEWVPIDVSARKTLVEECLKRDPPAFAKAWRHLEAIARQNPWDESIRLRQDDILARVKGETRR